MTPPGTADHDHDCSWRLLAERLAERLERLGQAASEDPHTGLANVQQFSRDIVRLAARQQRRGDPFSVAILEVRHDHAPDTPLDDADLVDIASALLETSRLEDRAAFLGGHEFGVVLEGTGRAGALDFLVRVGERISAYPLRRPEGRLFLGVAGGVAEASTHFQGIDGLCNEARAECRRAQLAVERSTGW